MAPTDRRVTERVFMADFLAENSLYYQSRVSSFTLANANNNDGNLNNVAGSYTRVVSATVCNTEMKSGADENGQAAFSYQSVTQKFEIRIDVNGDDRKYTAVGTDKDGTEFEKEINPYEVDPTFADFTEFAALCSYIRDTENLADDIMKSISNIAADDIFEKMNYLSAFSNEVGQFEYAGLNNLSVESLMPHINKLIDALMNKGTDQETDWRKMTDKEWEKLLERVDNDIDDIIEEVKEEEEKIEEEEAQK